LSGLETIGVDLGGTKMQVGVVDEERNVLHESRESSTGKSEDEIVEALASELEEARRAQPEVAAAGLGIPATIDHERGVAINAVNLEITDVPLRDLLEKRFGMPVFVDNDANVAGLAEFLYGAGKEAKNMVMLTIGTGIGGGLVLNGEIYRGSIGAGAELGHTVINENGPPCQGTCPNRGCVETYASGTALAREGLVAAGQHPGSALGKAHDDGEEITGKTVTEFALAGDETARGVIATAGRHLGVALSDFANIFDPDVIVIGGGVSAAGDVLLDPAREELRTRALPPMNKTEVKVAELGPDAGMIGAAAMARMELAKSGREG
jgi:glucokinase